MEQTVKCKICGKPYVVYAFYSGDQSACPSCRNKARSNVIDMSGFRRKKKESGIEAAIEYAKSLDW